MAKNKEKITCCSCVRIQNQVVPLERCTQQQKDYVGAKLQEQILNTLHQGTIVFQGNIPPDQEIFAEKSKQYQEFGEERV